MNAMPPEFHAQIAAPQADATLLAQWRALAKAASAIAALAGPNVARQADECVQIPAGLTGASQRRQVLISQTIGDLVAVMEPGLKALLEVHARGVCAQAPALALWQEFVAARQALVMLAAPAADNCDRV
ncbi:hypothetical protein GTZ99_10465 [Novosphingobium sp. FSY-8]|uniref:Phasin protein n=1 Tax=Novosphingobium ovatum TaxID=1908523 RepID=A0ABW9XEK4_9SPHN|nr:hypothetical protein [Novosphingobium ovatum]NBC36978.1 hypothetical protein [Novosphingobium ovatum]